MIFKTNRVLHLFFFCLVAVTINYIVRASCLQLNFLSCNVILKLTTAALTSQQQTEKKKTTIKMTKRHR